MKVLKAFTGAVVPGAWTTITLVGATASGVGYAPAYRVMDDNTIQLRGRLAFSGAYTASTTIATLPANARPSQVVTLSGRSASSAGWITIDTAGVLTWNSAQTAAQVLALDGLVYSL